MDDYALIRKHITSTFWDGTTDDYIASADGFTITPVERLDQLPEPTDDGDDVGTFGDYVVEDAAHLSVEVVRIMGGEVVSVFSRP